MEQITVNKQKLIELIEDHVLFFVGENDDCYNTDCKDDCIDCIINYLQNK